MKSKGYGQNIVQSGGAAAGAQSIKAPVSAIAAANPEVNKFDDGGNTNLHNRSYDGNTKQMERLLDKLAYINLPTNDKYGDDWLHKVTSSGKANNVTKKAIFISLKAAGATMVENDNHKTPIDYAYGNPELIGMLQEVFGASQE